MSDDQQMMSSIEQHSKRSTTADDLQVKSRKNRQTTTNTKKLKKEQNQRNQQRCDVNNRDSSIIKANASTKSVASPLSNISTLASNQDRSAGSVVITIRLLKMESSRNFNGASIVNNDENQHDNYSNNNNYPSSTRSVAQCEGDNGITSTIGDLSHTYVNLQENCNQNQNNSFSVDNNNVVLNQSEIGALSSTQTNCGRVKENCVGGTAAAATINNLMIYENSGNKNNSGQNERNSIKNQNVNCALRSEASICDKNQANCTSQSEQPSSNTVNCLAHHLNTITLTDATRSSSSSFTTSDASQSHTIDMKPKSLQDNSSAFIPSNFIGSVSPYPHHIPIANLIRPDYLNAVTDERKSNMLRFI